MCDSVEMSHTSVINADIRAAVPLGIVHDDKANVSIYTGRYRMSHLVIGSKNSKARFSNLFTRIILNYYDFPAFIF